MKFRLLQADEIEVKVKQVSEKGAVALLYKTARTDMTLLDETVGAENWECDYKVVNDNLYCGIGVTCNDREVWKWDCGIESREDGEGNEKKGEASDAFKRAGFKWGIGRELYTAPFIFLNVPTKKNNNGKWELANRYAKFKLTSITYNDDRTIASVEVCDDNGVIVYPNRRGGTNAKAAKTANIAPTTDTLGEAETIGCRLDRWARHLGKSEDDLTEEEVRECIKQRRAYLNNEERNAARGA